MSKGRHQLKHSTMNVCGAKNQFVVIYHEWLTWMWMIRRKFDCLCSHLRHEQMEANERTKANRILRLQLRRDGIMWILRTLNTTTTNLSLIRVYIFCFVKIMFLLVSLYVSNLSIIYHLSQMSRVLIARMLLSRHTKTSTQSLNHELHLSFNSFFVGIMKKVFNHHFLPKSFI